MSKLFNQFKSASLWSIVNIISKSILSLLISYLVIKDLSVEDFGIFTLLLALIGYIQMAVSPGFIQVINRFIPQFYEEKDFFGIHYFLKRYLKRTFFLSVFFLFVTCLFSEFVENLFKLNNFLSIFRWIVFFIPFYLVCLIFNRVFHCLFLQKTLSVINAISESFRLISLLIFFSFQKSIDYLLLSQGLTWLLAFVLYVYYYRKLVYIKYKERFIVKEYEFKKYKKYGFYTFFNEIGAKVLNSSTDYFIISAYLGPVSTGYYAFVNKVLTVSTNFLPNRIFKETLRTFYYRDYSNKKSKNSLHENFDIILKFNLLFIVPLMYVLLTYGEYYINMIFDNKYNNALSVLYVFAIFLPTKCLTFPLGLFLTAMEDVKIILYSKLASFINILIGIIVVQKYGVLGLSFVTCLSILLKDLIIYFYAFRKYNLKINLLEVSKILFIGSAIYFVGKYSIEISSVYVNTFLVFFMICITYALYFFLSLDLEQRKFLLRNIKK